MGNRSRQKGDRFELKCVDAFIEHGIPSQRVPLSGAAGGLFKDDLRAQIKGNDWKIEAKKRGDGFKNIYKWLDDHHALIIGADHKPALIVMPLDQFAKLVGSNDDGI